MAKIAAATEAVEELIQRTAAISIKGGNRHHPCSWCTRVFTSNRMARSHERRSHGHELARRDRQLVQMIADMDALRVCSKSV
jgi:uncharacterized C2H2 Zn-finger protein